MRLALIGLSVAAAISPASAAEVTRAQCDAIWRLVLFEMKNSSAYSEVISDISGTLAVATNPDGVSIQSPAFQARYKLAAEVSGALNKLQPMAKEIWSSDAVPAGTEALRAACPRKGAP